MAIKRRRPVNPSLRFQTFIDNSDLTTDKPEKSLIDGSIKRCSGRNAYGRITVRHRGGGAARNYRIVDFRRSQKDVEGIVSTIEYDPNRNVRIGLVKYTNGAKTYVLMPNDLKVGSKILASVNAEARVGNSMPIRAVPVGFFVHNVEVKPGSGGKFARGAGTSIQIVAKSETHATLKMPSSEIRLVLLDCWVTVGILGNADFKNICWGKAGRRRHLGFRPSVRGMAMNPVDHPHGGGEGRSKSGSHPMTPWGKGCKGTRTKKKVNPLVLKRRKSNK
ncbi:MAG: 50S ribosomal protein L2 [candidate division TM6 bacterium GW2011_GWF2_30_66]|jgi:large subunit ribosomal protein L2|nr:MAG: 50S ribosomal protein L2 [candidate division TM6 bacterium GW2011_GWF2_30_66]